MSRIVGYAGIDFAVNSADLKTVALVTDEIRLTVNVDKHLSVSPAMLAELMWLQEQGAVSLYNSAWQKLKATEIENWPGPNSSGFANADAAADTVDTGPLLLSIFARIGAVIANYVEPDISPMIIASAKTEALFRAYELQYVFQNVLETVVETLGLNSNVNSMFQAPALEVVLHQMPVPDDTTAWENILEWKSDEAAREKYRRLKHWVHNVVGGTERPKHLEDHLLTLLDDYRAHMRLHRMKVRTAQTKTIVVPILETVRNVFTGRWGEWAKAAFTVKEQQHALLEAELKAPGREVAYIVDAHERFGTNGS